MKITDLSWLVAAVLLNALAQLGLKMATHATGAIDGSWRAMLLAARQLGASGSFWLAMSAYGLSVIVWIVGLSRLPVSQAYPVLSLGYIVTALLAWWILGEGINLERWAGIFLILCGVVFISSSQS